MKKFYLFATAVTMLTACTNSEKMTADFSNDDPVMIGFETFHEKATKATGEITQASDFTKAHGGFGVWGFKSTEANSPEKSTASDFTCDIHDATKYTPIFNNVKVWYEDASNEAYKPKGFTYAVPKYWDKNMSYVFFAYAPFNDSKDNNNPIVNLDLNTGKITVKDIESIQNISKKNAANNTGADLQFVASDATSSANVNDYLMGKYETNQKLTNTNQKEKTDYGTYASNPDLRSQTVGFTFGHMLSQLKITLKAAERYSGVESIVVRNFSIKNMPATSATKTVFTQTSPTSAAGTYSNTYYTSTLKIIENGNTEETNDVAAKESLYILKNGSINNSNVITEPTDQPQIFSYYVAPNKPATNNSEGATDADKKYYLNIKYTINYVDDIHENVTISDYDMSEKLTELEQNNIYSLTISVGLNQIYFTVDAVTPWTNTYNQTLVIN